MRKRGSYLRSGGVEGHVQDGVRVPLELVQVSAAPDVINVGLRKDTTILVKQHAFTLFLFN